MALSDPNNAPDQKTFKSNSPYYVNIQPKLSVSSTQKKFMSAQNFHINPLTMNQQTNLLDNPINKKGVFDPYDTTNNININAKKNDNTQPKVNNQENDNLLANTNNLIKKYNIGDEITPEKMYDKSDELLMRFNLIRRIMHELKYC